MWLYRIGSALRPILKPVARLYWRTYLVGKVDSIPETGPLILAGNHTSFLDPYILGFMFPRPIRFFITRDWYDKSAIWRGFFRAFNALPVESTLEATVESVCRVLAKGDVVGVYPEGRISYDGRIQRFRSGICYFAARSGSPVLPLGIRGVFQTLPRTRRIPRPARIVVTVGSPMRFPESPRDTAPDVRSVLQFRDRLFREVCRLSGQEGLATSSTSRRPSPSGRTGVLEPPPEVPVEGARTVCAHSMADRLRGK